MQKPIAAVCLTICLLPLKSASGQDRPSIQLDDISRNLDFVHTDGHYGQFFLIESMSAGLAMLDYDGDGDLDVFLLNGSRIEIPGSSSSEEGRQKPKSNRLFRNDGDFHFTDVTEQSGVSDSNMSLGVAVADYDNDGCPDIYVSNYGVNSLLHNNGDGTFSEMINLASAGRGSRVGGGVSFFDKDSDGDLDLYIGNYIQFDASKHKIHFHKGLPAYPSPMSFQPEKDHLLENNGDGTFQDVTDASGINKVAGRSMGLVSFDYDQDGDIDVFVANDTQANFLFENDGNGVFEEVGLFAGVAFDFSGKPQASMGVELCDVDRDGLLDLFVTSFSEEFTTLYRNEDGFFSDSTLQMGASAATFPHVTWGIIGEDFDNDGKPEFLVGTGDLDEDKQARGGAAKTTGFDVKNVVLSQANGQLKDLKGTWGTAAKVKRSTRGLLGGDLNQDGRIDAIALNARNSATLMQNSTTTPVDSHISVQLVGTESNRDALGAMILVNQNGRRTQVEQVRSGHSYQSDRRSATHFGVSPQEVVKVTIAWPSGRRQHVDCKAGQQITLVEAK